MNAHWLKPDWEPELTVPYLPLQHFLDIGIKAMVLDVDRTLLPDRTNKLPESVTSWINQAHLKLEIHLLSNNPLKRELAVLPIN